MMMIASQARSSSRRILGSSFAQLRRANRPFSAVPTEDTSAEPSTTLYMWGTDVKGSLLKPVEEQSNEKFIDVPALVQWTEAVPDESLKEVVCGATDTAFITQTGRCFVSGENKQGQLGVGHKNAVTTPVEVKLPTEEPDTTVKQVALGQNFGAFVDSVGDLYTTGLGGSTFSGMGALGHGNDQSYVEPKLVESLIEDGCVVDQVQVGEAHMTVLTTEGEVLTTGAGSYGRLGNFDTTDQLYLEPVEILTTGVTQIAGGKSFTLALSAEGVVYGWGRNHKGQLGTGLGLAVDMYAMQNVPEPIETDELLGRKVIQVSAGHSHAACITASGEVFWWGMAQNLEPVRVDALLHTQIVQVMCGQDYTLAIDKDGHMYSFGKGRTGVLGQGSAKAVNQATLMEAFGDKKVIQASAGWKHAACLVQE